MYKSLTFSMTDLVSAALGGKVLGFSDEWFAEASNLLTPTAPIRQPGKMVYTGAWYDGKSDLGCGCGCICCQVAVRVTRTGFGSIPTC